jgi:hypothetical protein
LTSSFVAAENTSDIGYWLDVSDEDLTWPGEGDLSISEEEGLLRFKGETVPKERFLIAGKREES